MARPKSDVSKSEEIRTILKTNPKMAAKDVLATLHTTKGIVATEGLVYFVKGRMFGRKGRRRRAAAIVEKVALTTGNGDAVKTIHKVKSFASEMGGLKRLKALVDALTD